MTVAAYFLFGFAVLAANLPLLSERVFGVLLLKRAEKPFWIRLSEWGVLFLLFVGAALWTESREMPIHAQGWAFWVVLVCLFVVLSYPGFVFRFFWKKTHKSQSQREKVE